MPVSYQGDKIEYLNVRQNMGLLDVSHMDEVLIKGIDALALCKRLFTNHISKAIDGYDMLTDEGSFVDNVIVYKFAQAKLLVCINICNDEKDFAHMKSIANKEFSLSNMQVRSMSHK